MAFEDYYAKNPMAIVDQNQWTDQIAEVNMNFLTGPTIFTPLVTWENRSQQVGSSSTIYPDLIEGDVDADAMAYDQEYIPEPLHVDSRFRKTSMSRWGDKVQLHKSSQYFQMWKMSGGRDWRPLMRGVLGSNVVRKIEMASRNAFLKGGVANAPTTYWTYGGNATSFATLSGDDKFTLDQVHKWNLSLAQTGTPVVPGNPLTEKVCIVPPGCIYDFQESLAAASGNQASLWRDAVINSGAGVPGLKYEIGTFKNIRFIENPNDRYGFNSSVLYNCGAITKQVTITKAVNAGDGAPDPELDAEAVDGVWHVGQKNRTHYIETSSFTAADFLVGDIVTLHTLRTARYGVANGVDPLSGKTINRRVVKVDIETNPSGDYYRLSFDRPVMANYTTALSAGVYGYVTKAKHVGFCLVVGAGNAMHGNLNQPIQFYEPRPVDDFDSVWRFTWDMLGGMDWWEPAAANCHFVNVTIAKPGGVIAP